jgi:hypothetical protein
VLDKEYWYIVVVVGIEVVLTLAVAVAVDTRNILNKMYAYIFLILKLLL